MLDLHQSAVTFVNRVSKNKSLSLLSIFREEDLSNLIHVSQDIFNSKDILKVQLHLETILNMARNDPKLGQILCQKGVVIALSEILASLTTSTQKFEQNRKSEGPTREQYKEKGIQNDQFGDG